jgi:nitroreductase
MKLSANGWVRVKATYIVLKGGLLSLISSWGPLANIYYAFFSSAYSREHRGVASGLRAHIADLKEGSSLFLLRRNIHRLEKGLIMPERRPIFAVEYIGETVDYYVRSLNSAPQGIHGAELAWARNILTEYFESVSDHPLVEPARQCFLATCSEDATGSGPYARGQESRSVSREDLLKLVKQRKSVRTYLQKPVPHDLVDQALEIAGLAPSSCNRQPMKYWLFDEGSLYKELAHLPLGTSGFADNIPMICVLTGDLSAYSYERDRHSIYVDGCLSAMLFMLGLESVGLASCGLNWAEINSLDRRLEKLLKLPPHERCIMCLAIGYADPDGLVAYSAKKDLETLRSYNQRHEPVNLRG